MCCVYISHQRRENEAVNVGRNTIWGLTHQTLTFRHWDEWRGVWIKWFYIDFVWYSECKDFKCVTLSWILCWSLLLCPQLTNLNLANRMLGRESATLNPKMRHTAAAAAAATQGPVKAVHSGTDLCSSTRWVPRRDIWREYLEIMEYLEIEILICKVTRN